MVSELNRAVEPFYLYVMFFEMELIVSKSNYLVG